MMNHGNHTTAQPTTADAYANRENAVSKTETEWTSGTGQRRSSVNDARIFTRRPGDEAGVEPKPSALAAGGTREPIAKEAEPADELDGEQMRAPGEGEVMRAQAHRTGTAEEPSLTDNLDRKKEEQQGRREQMQQQRHATDDIGGDRGRRGGPATVDGR